VKLFIIDVVTNQVKETFVVPDSPDGNIAVPEAIDQRMAALVNATEHSMVLAGQLFVREHVATIEMSRQEYEAFVKGGGKLPGSVS
jgi:hypothetical protein